MEDPGLKTKVVHSVRHSAWNVVGISLGGKFKVARVPYSLCNDEKIDGMNRMEAFNHASFISHCFNNSETILKK